MGFRSKQSMLAGALFAACGLYGVHANAAAATLDCDMKYSLTGWSAIFKHAEGTGLITCNNGKSYPVDITAVGGGLTVGKYKIQDGKGEFSNVTAPSELFGDYVQGEANAGVVKSAQAQVLTKGSASLALAGHGNGVDLGISIGKFTISRADRADRE